MIILTPISWLYGLVIKVRNAMYDRGILGVHDLGTKTISVGNITTGGTGKTPLVKLIAEILSDSGEKVCILTRGYGRRNENERVVVCSRDTMVADPWLAGDEPVELARNLLGKAIIIADADRVGAAKWAKENFGITVFVLDDAFQHRRARRNIDIVCIDPTNPFGSGRILPAGRLREAIDGLGRANAFVITQPDQNEQMETLESRLRKANGNAAIFRASASISKIKSLDEFHARSQTTQTNSFSDVFAFSGLANNKKFVDGLTDFGITPLGLKEFGDHHNYTQSDADEIGEQARSAGAEYLVTTTKDAVKLEVLEFSLPCYVAEIETVIDDPDRFCQFVLSA
jgi:tetraacyldisaccharide 4'-kinase